MSGSSWSRNALHLAALASLAVAQPLFDLLGDNAAFFTVRGAGRWQIVAFALGVVLIPPALLLAVELVAGQLRREVHLAFVALLGALIALQALARVAAGAWTIAAALAVGVAFAFAYTRAGAVRSFVTVLGVAPLAFLALFLFASPVSRLVVDGVPPVRLAHVRATAPVVLVVFDEFSSTTLMNAARDIDAARYPNFAMLAGDGTWFRNATSVHPWTTDAVPAILDGRFPRPHKLPVYRDHPQNLFTLLGASYAVDDHETFTHLCPPKLCAPRSGAVPRGPGTLLSDVGIVYGHLVLPRSLDAHLPSIAGRWGNFRAQRPRRAQDPSQQFREFVRSIRATKRPTLSVLHVGLPHFPWQYIPDGRRYTTRFEPVPGVGAGEMWGGDPWLPLAAYQRYVLQVGYVDRLVGELVDRLRTTGMYDRSLVAVTADHGVSFRAGDGRRALTTTNAQDIAFVPLFVKAPHQRRGRVDDTPVRTIDVLPTIADELGARIPWRIDGRPARVRARSGSADELVIDGRPFSARELERRRARTLARKLELFGSGASLGRVFRIGDDAHVVGACPDDFGVAPDERAIIERVPNLNPHDPRSPLVPSYVHGRLSGRGAHAGQRIAVAVGACVRAVTRSYSFGGAIRFGALVPPDAFRRGQNHVLVFRVTPHRLEQLGRA